MERQIIGSGEEGGKGRLKPSGGICPRKYVSLYRNELI